MLLNKYIWIFVSTCILGHNYKSRQENKEWIVRAWHAEDQALLGVSQVPLIMWYTLNQVSRCFFKKVIFINCNKGPGQRASIALIMEQGQKLLFSPLEVICQSYPLSLWGFIFHLLELRFWNPTQIDKNISLYL